MASKKNTAIVWMIGIGSLAVAGIGIYFYEKSKSTPAAALPPTGGTAATGPQPPVLASGQNVYNFSSAEIAQLNAAHPTWAAQGIPLATWNGYLSGFQVGLWNAGFRPTS